MGEEDIVFHDGRLGDEAAVGVERFLWIAGEPVGVSDAEEGVGDAELVVERFANGEGFGEEGEGGVGVAVAGPGGAKVIEDDAGGELVALFSMEFQRLLVFGDGGFVTRLGGEGGGAFGMGGGVFGDLGEGRESEGEEEEPHLIRV